MGNARKGLGRALRLCGLVVGLLGGCHDAVEELPLVWKYEAKAPSAAAPLVTVNYVAMPTDAGVALVGPAGEPRCFFDAHGAVRATPRSNGQLLYVSSTNGIIYAVDATCNVAWKFLVGEGIVGEAAIAGGTLFVAGYEGHVYALSADTGQLNWSFPAVAPPTAAATATAAAAPAGEGAAATTGEAHAKGKGKGKRGHKAKTKGKGKAKGKGKGKAKTEDAQHADHPAAAPAAAVPPGHGPKEAAEPFATSGVAVADGVVYFGGHGHVYALNAADGGLRWTFETDGLVTATPWVADGVVYVGSQDGNLYAIRIADHTLAWKLTTQDRITAPARLINHVLYVGSHDKHLYAVDPVKGSVHWKVDTESPVVAAVSAYKSLIVLVESNGTVQLVQGSDKDAKVVWKHALAVPMTGAPVVSDERLYLDGTDGILRSVALSQVPLGAAP